jgi:hypothetical protein
MQQGLREEVMQVQVNFVFEKETPGTFRFKEVTPEGERPVVATLYVKKHAVPAGTTSLVVTIEPNS